MWRKNDSRKRIDKIFLSDGSRIHGFYHSGGTTAAR